jgi:hypothetical protein
MMRSGTQADVLRRVGPNWSMRVRQVEFPPAIKAHSIGTALDGEDATEVTVPTAKDELKNWQQFHKSCARWRRSQLPLASNHSSSERTLARARAIAQSAAP